MNANLRAAAAALLACMVLTGAAPLAQAGGHMSLYVLTPEHDDAGRSEEPNFAGTTALFGGAPVAERSVDATLDGIGEPHDPSKDVAPGCTDDQGRQPSGLCWLWLRTGVVGIPGMGGDAAPGSFTPKKGDKVRFMDLLGTLQAVRAYVEVNRKLDDTGAREQLAGLDPNFRNEVLAAALGATMWYGTWQDKNGNGVIDAEGQAPFDAGQAARNEFTWEGQCKTFTGGASAVPPWVCTVREPSQIFVWAFPGNHHASTNGGTLVFSPADVPGQQAMCFGLIASQIGPIVNNAATTYTGATAIGCPNRIQDIEENDDTLDVGAADPVLGEQDSPRPDFTMAHRTGDPNPNTRHLVAGLGWAMYFYDQSLLVSFTTLAALNPPNDPGPRGFDPGRAHMVDVDRYATWSPAAEAMLLGTVKPVARTQWVTLRDAYIPANTLVDGKLNSGATGLGAANPLVGTGDDLLLDPGFSHEPNHPLDVYPHVVRGTPATHEGFFNDYSGYATLGPDGTGHLFADGQLFRTEPLIRPGVPPPLPPPPVPAGPFLTDSLSPVPLRALAGGHARSLGPGMYDFLGGIGAWHDKPHRNVEDALLAQFDYTSAPDGWVGNVINTTGQYRYRDYMPQVCTANAVAGLHEYAQCHPYAGGTISQPNDFGTDDGEMLKGCGGVGSGVGTLQVVPVDGVWSIPVMVYRNLEELQVDRVLSDLQDYTNSVGPITLAISCAQNTLVNARDYLLLPLGNPDEPLRTIWTATSSLVPGEVVVDVDEYAAFGA